MNKPNYTASPIILFRASLEGGDVAFSNPTLLDNVSMSAVIPKRLNIAKGLVLQFSLVSRFGIKDERLQVQNGTGLLYCNNKTIDDFKEYVDGAFRSNPAASVVSLNEFINPIYANQRHKPNTPS